MDAWMAWHFRRCFWQVGVTIGGQRIVLVEVCRQVPADGEMLLALFAAMSKEELISWAAAGPGIAADAAPGPAVRPKARMS